jgi:hypothetical protein
MVAPQRAAWVRAAAVAVLLSWLPCVPVGLCVAAPSEPAAHGCCPRPAAVTISAAPRECWLQYPAPLPVVAPTVGQGAPAVADFHSDVPVPAAAYGAPRPVTFSALAVVLRI